MTLVFGAVAFAAIVASVTTSNSAAETVLSSPSPVASASASSAKPTPSVSPTERLAIVNCAAASFFAWPDRHVAPQPTHYPPARVGDAFHVIGTGTITPGEMNLTETTIDVVEPYGAGKHYWIATACIT